VTGLCLAGDAAFPQCLLGGHNLSLMTTGTANTALLPQLPPGVLVLDVRRAVYHCRVVPMLGGHVRFSPCVCVAVAGGCRRVACLDGRVMWMTNPGL